MTQVFDEYGNYIYPTDVPLKEPNHATSAINDTPINCWVTVAKPIWAYRKEITTSGLSYGCPFGY